MFFPKSSWNSSALREKCPNAEFFSGLYSVQIQETTDQKNSVFGHFPQVVLVKDAWCLSS